MHIEQSIFAPMPLFTAVILGIIQGLSEFLPISSTAHLTLAAKVMGVLDPSHPERWTSFMATIQLGTLAAVLLYFRTDIMRSVTGWVSENIGSTRRPFREQGADARLAWFVIIGTIPIVVIGLAFKDMIEGALTKDLHVIAGALIGVGLLLWLAERRASFYRSTSDLTMTDAVVIGAAQCLALVPGSSRSGSTMMAAMFRGMTREHAARFSFLLSIPSVLAAGLLQFSNEVGHFSEAGSGTTLAVATLAAFASGYWSIDTLLKFLRTRTMAVFVIYRVGLGLVILLAGCQPKQQPPVESVRQITPPAETLSVPSVDSLSSAVATDTLDVLTSKGTITIELYGQDAPKTVANFLTLVGRKYYDGTLIHRVARDFVVQMGDPTTRDRKARNEWGRGGETATGEPLMDELNDSAPSARRGYRPGIVAMARKSAPNTGTSQFFICLEKASALPYQYTIFGSVIDGMEVVTKIGSVEVEPGPLGDTDGTPKSPIVVKNIRLHVSGKK
jgi:undecaprenyl-diphosphatase